MGRLLDEDAVIKVLECWQKAFRENSHYVSASDLSLVVKDVRELPPAQPEPKEGHWIPVHPIQSDDPGAYMCSECETGMWEIRPSSYHYCPHCGAKMKGETDGQI